MVDPNVFFRDLRCLCSAHTVVPKLPCSVKAGIQLWNEYRTLVEKLRGQWEEIEASGALDGYVWDYKFRTRSTATAQALDQFIWNCAEGDQRIVGHIINDVPTIDSVEHALAVLIEKRLSSSWMAAIDEERRRVIRFFAPGGSGQAGESESTNGANSDDGTADEDEPSREMIKLVYEYRAADPQKPWPEILEALQSNGQNPPAEKTLRGRLKEYCDEIGKTVPKSRPGRRPSTQKRSK